MLSLTTMAASAQEPNIPRGFGGQQQIDVKFDEYKAAPQGFDKEREGVAKGTVKLIEYQSESVGTVRDIGIFYTKLVTFDNKTVFIPNGKVTEAKIVNYTETPTRRIDLSFDISYSADFDKARETVLGIIAEEKLILKTPEPIVRMSSHNNSSISIDVLVWVNNGDYLTERYNMTEAVKAAFDENGIEIPFPQLDIHVKDKV